LENRWQFKTEIDNFCLLKPKIRETENRHFLKTENSNANNPNDNAKT